MSFLQGLFGSETTWRTRLVRAYGMTMAIFLLMGAVTFLLIYRLVYYAPGVKELSPHINEYISDTWLTDVSNLASPYRIGKLIAVNVHNRVLDKRLQKALPADLRAAQHDEVGTIVWVSWSEKFVGTYTNEGKAY